MGGGQGRVGFEAVGKGQGAAKSHRVVTGEQQRLSLARAMSCRPDVMLLDEPTANLDPDNVRRVEALVTDYLITHGAAALWVSHDPGQAHRVASRALISCPHSIQTLCTTKPAARPWLARTYQA